MTSSPLSVYALCAVALLSKYAFTITLQARERFRCRTFGYEEDARCWNGVVAADSELCTRAQHLLRNDAENQVFFLAIGASYVALGCWAEGAWPYFVGYVLARLAHGYWMLRGRQPHRNRAFAVGSLLLLVMSGHVVGAVLRGGPGP